ncbi:MAG TPA: Ig-like domain-containing protein, partial [Aquaticitalea sp.]|nr:Ig-like domain-containing protein [Aquaticitalea sp.]
LNDVGANKYLNADGTYGVYQDTKDAGDITMIQNDGFVSYSSNDFTYTPINLVPYPVLPQNTRPSNFYVSNPHIPEVWFQANVPSGQNHNSFAPSGYTWLEEYLNGVDRSNDVIAVQGVVVAPDTAELQLTETVQLTATITPANATNQNGTWSSSNSNIATVSTNGLVSAVAEGNVTITFTTVDGGFADSAEITVFPAALQASAGDDQTICQGQSATLTATGGVTYLWSTGETTATITVSPTQTTTYTVTVFDASGNNSDSDDVTVIVNPLPVADAGDDVSICLGESTTLTANGGTSYLWNTGATTASITVSPNSTTIYSVQVTQNGCSSNDNVTVTVNNPPTVNAGNDVTIF